MKAAPALPQPARESAAVPVDLSVLPSLTGCQDEQLEEFLWDFLDAAAHAWQVMGQALGESHLAALGEAAQQVKTAARYVGALQLGHLSEALEQASQRHRLAECNLLLPQWHAEWQRVDAYIAQVLVQRQRR
jgi:hypothetical protein